MGFSDIVFLIAEDLAAIGLGYACSFRSTLVVEIDEYIKIMDEDAITPPWEKSMSLLSRKRELRPCPWARREVCSPNIRLASEFKSLKVFQRGFHPKVFLQNVRGKRVPLWGRLTSAEDNVIDEGCESSLGRRGLRPSHPPLQEAKKVIGDVPMEGGSLQVHDFDVKVLCDGLSFYAISSLSLHILSLGDVHVSDYWKFFS